MISTFAVTGATIGSSVTGTGWPAGTFLTRDGALRYALFEAGGDTSLVHVTAAGGGTARPGHDR